MAGWIALYRSFEFHWLNNFDEPDKALAWINLLMMANHEDKKFMIKGRVVECKRGQIACSQVTLQQKFKMSQNKLKRFLVLLKNDGMIDFETNDLTTIITICNYNDYQQDERADERPVGRADERPVGRADERPVERQLNNVTSKQKDSTTTSSRGSGGKNSDPKTDSLDGSKRDDPSDNRKAKNPARLIPDDWRPDDRCIQLIARAGIPQEFAEGLKDEFVMYWEERGEKRANWQSTFLNNTKRAWEREQQKQKSLGDRTSQNQGSFQKQRGNYGRKDGISEADWNSTDF